MKQNARSLAALHGAVMLFGLSAVLARRVAVPAVLVAGVLITVPSFSVTDSAGAGAVWGMVSSLAYGVLTLCNRRLSAG